MNSYLTQNWFDDTVRILRSDVIQGSDNQEKISYDFFREFYLKTIFNGNKEGFDIIVKEAKKTTKNISIKKGFMKKKS